MAGPLDALPNAAAGAHAVRDTQSLSLPDSWDVRDPWHNGARANRTPGRTGAKRFPNFEDPLPLAGVIPRFASHISPAEADRQRQPSLLDFKSRQELERMLPDYGVKEEKVKAVAGAIYDAIKSFEHTIPEAPGGVWFIPPASGFTVVGPNMNCIYVTSEGISRPSVCFTGEGVAG